MLQRQGKRILLCFFACLLVCPSLTGCNRTNPNLLEGVEAVKVANIQRAHQEYSLYLEQLQKFPLHFTYGETTYAGFGNVFEELSRDTVREGAKERTVVTLRHEDGLLSVRIEAAIYPAYGAYEWTVYFTNGGSRNTPRLADVRANVTLPGTDAVLKGIGGDAVKLYAPYHYTLKDHPIRFESSSGRPTHNTFPYFNLEHGTGGTLIAIGWPGRWSADFTEEQKQTTFAGGLYCLDSFLQPGETVRTPLMAFVCYEGRQEQDAMNLWRQWFIHCNMRQIDGELFPPVMAGYTGLIYGEMTRATEANQIYAMDKYLDHGIPLTYWWMDAGWYTGPAGTSMEGWPATGSWVVDTERFPTKFHDISEHAQSRGLNTLLWFEPEVVRVDLDLMEQEGVKKDWYVGRVMEGTWLEGSLLDLGNEDARAWLVDRVAGVLRDGGISLYRQDFNVDPAAAWNTADQKDRIGFVENRYVQGYLAYWDELIALFPNMMIDSCASGGGRNDLETMRRAIPVHKTDFEYHNYDVKQSMHLSLFAWLPYFGTPAVNGDSMDKVDKYGVRSAYCSWVGLWYNVRSKNLEWDRLGDLCREWEQINSYYYSDYYPLTPWSNTSVDWRGWEFFDQTENKGFLQFFRPEDSKETENTYVLYGLEPEQTYRLTDLDGLFSTSATGRDLMEKGFRVLLPDARSTALILIEPAE